MIQEAEGIHDCINDRRSCCCVHLYCDRRQSAIVVLHGRVSALYVIYKMKISYTIKTRNFLCEMVILLVFWLCEEIEGQTFRVDVACPLGASG